MQLDKTMKVRLRPGQGWNDMFILDYGEVPFLLSFGPILIKKDVEAFEYNRKSC